MFGSIVHWHWKASIISHLSVDIPDIPFTNAEELLKSSYQITMVRDTALTAALETANSDNMKKLWSTKFEDQDKSLVSNVSEALKVVEESVYTLFEDSVIVKSLPEYKDCKIIDTGYTLLSFQVAFAVAKNSPLRGVFNAALAHLQESGVLDRIKKNYLPLEPVCGQGSGTSLGFGTICSAFAALGFGLALAGLCLWGEFIAKHYIGTSERRSSDRRSRVYNNYFV